ncbi:MAG: hypothetical protein KKA73_15595 [Chloroflexi bacterium]|nr:hypothetical protein [Chloroflexota bacterium]MBU1749109.1 hypothetical protein [Chloroflexota bacterium]MBU1877916.1 hypothetical protein [Chloroflexota bacterium]
MNQLAGVTDNAAGAREAVPILVGVVVSLVYVVAVVTVVIGVLRFTREHVRQLGATEPSATTLLARLPLGRA